MPGGLALRAAPAEPAGELDYLAFAGAGAEGAAGAAAAFFAGFTGLAGRVLPNEPLNIFPFLVFLSPRPIKILLVVQYNKV